LQLVKGENVFLDVLRWKTFSQSVSTASSNVFVMDSMFYMPQFDRHRMIRIYLPPGYQDATERYPVLYMHDGQNLFDQATSFSGEWAVDELFDRLHSEGKKVPIVVGIDNGGEHRIAEYTPWKNERHGGGDGERYAKFIVETLKPYVDLHYRSLPDRKNTVVAGSSLGGLISFYLILQHSETFGMAAVFSPSFWFSRDVYDFAGMKRKHPARIYMLGGTNESEHLVSQMEEMMKTLRKSGFRKRELHLKVVEGGRHNEELWRTQLEESVYWLFKL
jgi:predicted alpha/beta superfamily hydrolase